MNRFTACAAAADTALTTSSAWLATWLALAKNLRACRKVCRQEGKRVLIRRKVRRASRAVMTTVTVMTTAQTAITDRRKSAKEDSSAIHILSVTRPPHDWGPWLCLSFAKSAFAFSLRRALRSQARKRIGEGGVPAFRR